MTGVTAEVARLEHAAGVSSRRTPSPRVLGVDGCSTGWAGILRDGEAVVGLHAGTLRELLDRALAGGPLAAVVVDMPLGLADSGTRAADLEARTALGPRRSSIFLTPTRAAVLAPTRAEASAINVGNGGGGVTAQAFAIVPKVVEADALLADDRPFPLVEGHPELSFAEMAGGVLMSRKRSYAGHRERRELLASQGIDLDAAELGQVGLLAAADDVVDAAAMAWTATRVATGTACSRPDPPVVHSDGWPAAIWT